MGKTTLARYLATQFGVPHIDADAIRRGVGVTWNVLCDENIDNGLEMGAVRAAYREMMGSGASLAASLAAVELMDQGYDTVTAGVGDLAGAPPDGWADTVRELIVPHRLFGVLVVADVRTQTERVSARENQWGLGFPTLPGWEHFVVDTTTASVPETAETIINAAHLTARNPSG